MDKNELCDKLKDIAHKDYCFDRNNYLLTSRSFEHVMYILANCSYFAVCYLLDYIKLDNSDISVDNKEDKVVIYKKELENLDSDDYIYFVELIYEPKLNMIYNNKMYKSGFIYKLSCKSKIFNQIDEISIIDVVFFDINNDNTICYDKAEYIKYMNDYDQIQLYESLIIPIRKYIIYAHWTS